MRHLLSGLILFVGALSMLPAQAQLIETDAEFAVILDHDSGEVLYSKGGDALMIPASMTKVMTAHIVFERLRTGEIQLDDRFTVSEKAWREGGWATGGSTMGLGIGETPTVEELLRGVIVLSGNDACIVLAEGLSGSEAAFSEDMTELAQSLGLSSATFMNSSGLDAEGHRISAADLARLASLTISEFPQYYELYAEDAYEWNGIRQTNRNPLLGRLDGVDGLKTGHLSVSGYGLVASAQRGGERRIIVVNGLESVQARAQEAERLMRFAFSAFETRTVRRVDQRLADLDVWMGSARTVGVGLKEEIAVTAHKRAFARGQTEIVYDAPLMAPIAAGDHIADLVITLEDKDPVVAPLYASETVDRLDFFGKAVEGLSYMISPGS
ncbi:MAG: D-alanyl-D-alanine carboxypeptidase family protein [Pseudomonadota bacterium]